MIELLVKGGEGSGWCGYFGRNCTLCVCEGVSLDLILESFQKKLRQFNFCDTFPSFG